LVCRKKAKMNAVFVHQRINRGGFLKSQERGFGRRNQTDFAPAIFAPGSDKMPLMPDNINFGRFDHDFSADLSHKSYLPEKRLSCLKHNILKDAKKVRVFLAAK
jgi:hypothetical protein